MMLNLPNKRLIVALKLIVGGLSRLSIGFGGCFGPP
jgi:hypothetical protein